MEAPNSLPALLESLTQSLESAQEITPRISSIGHPKDGISLLDVKNELLLSYLQNLVFLILLKLRNAKDDSMRDDDGIDEAVRSKLIELRLYLEKGTRPLEEKLRFSIERFLGRARDSQNEDKKKIHGKSLGGNARTGSESESDSGSDADSESDEEEDESQSDVEGSVDGTTNPSRKGTKSHTGKPSSAPRLAGLADDSTVRPAPGNDNAPNGIYRPPRRERHVMDEPSSHRGKQADRRPAKSHTMDEFVNSELSTAPMAEPSIGTTIVQGGRKIKTSREREKEAERQVYEETNFVRLPNASKKDRARENREAARAANGRISFGGEEWYNLGEGVDRIDRLTKRKDGGRGGNVRAMLEKSRKRGPDTVDGPRGSGEMGDRFQKRVKLLEGGRRDRGKNR